MASSAESAILDIYDAAADESLWPNVLHRLAEEIDAFGCIVFEWQSPRHDRQLRARAVSGNYDIDDIKTYMTHFAKEEGRDQDVFEAHSLRQDTIDLIEDHVLAPTLADLKALPNVAMMHRRGLLHRAAGLLNKDNTAISRFSVQLTADRGRLTPAEHAHLATHLPHIAKALDLGRPAMQLAQERQGLLAALNSLTVGICILDPKGRIVVSNGEFARQMDHYRMFSAPGGGPLKFHTADHEKRFARLKEHALNHGKFGARPRKEAIMTDADSFLCVEVTPLNRSEEIGAGIFGGYMMHSVDTSLPLQSNTAAIQSAYGLTQAEVGLVDLIGKGLTNVQIAQVKDRSTATINTQVKSILSKTECATRTQFVRLMMSFGVSYVTSELPRS